METIGARSEKLLEEIKGFEAKRHQVAEEEARLAQEVAECQGKLNFIRAEGLEGMVDGNQVIAFEGRLEALRNQLAEARSTLDGLDQILASKRQEMKGARIADAREALATKEMSAALEGLVANAEALEKVRAAVLKTLRAGAKSLLGRIADGRREWESLVAERKELYQRRYKAMGPKAPFSQSEYYRLLKDDRVQMFGGGQDLSEVLELARFLEPLLDQSRRG